MKSFKNQFGIVPNAKSYAATSNSVFSSSLWLSLGLNGTLGWLVRLFFQPVAKVKEATITLRGRRKGVLAKQLVICLESKFCASESKHTVAEQLDERDSRFAVVFFSEKQEI